MRPSKIENYMEMAEVIAKRSHDAETKVGAVLVNNESSAVIATGFNGFIRGTEDNSLPNVRPDKYEFIIHAEQNLLVNCCRNAISTNDCTLICTMSPCKLCSRLMFNAGITAVIAKNLYKDFQELLTMPDLKVSCTQAEDGLYRIRYSVR